MQRRRFFAPAWRRHGSSPGRGNAAHSTVRREDAAPERKNARGEQKKTRRVSSIAQQFVGQEGLRSRTPLFSIMGKENIRVPELQ